MFSYRFAVHLWENQVPRRRIWKSDSHRVHFDPHYVPSYQCVDQLHASLCAVHQLYQLLQLFGPLSRFPLLNCRRHHFLLKQQISCLRFDLPPRLRRDDRSGCVLPNLVYLAYCCSAVRTRSRSRHESCLLQRRHLRHRRHTQLHVHVVPELRQSKPIANYPVVGRPLKLPDFAFCNHFCSNPRNVALSLQERILQKGRVLWKVHQEI